MTLIYFIVFYNLIYFFGKTITLNLLKSRNVEEIFCEYKINTFYPLISFFFIGNLANILNFILPIKNLIFFLPIIFITKINKLFVGESIKELLLTNFLFPAVLGVSIYGIGFHYDAGLYHLNHQNWLRESNIILGLTNIYFPYGWSSIVEYINGVLIISENYIFLHFVNLVFLNQFFVFLFNGIKTGKNSFIKKICILILIFGFLDNFGFDGGRNGFIYIQAVGKFDNVFATVFTIFNILIFNQIFMGKFEAKDLSLLTFLALFSFQIKYTGGLALALLFYYIIKFNNLKTSKLTSILIPYYSIFCLWLLKNLLSSGCFIFGIEVTCLENLSWYQNGLSNKAIQDTRNFNLAYFFDKNIHEWFIIWINKRINYVVFINFLISILLIIIFTFLFNKFKIKNSKILNFYILINLIIWILGAPDPRFGSGMFILFLFPIAYYIEEDRTLFNFIFKNNKIFYFLLLVCLSLLPRIDSYINYINNYKLNIFLALPYVEYQESKNWGVKPIESDQCWVNLDCTKFNVSIIEKKYFIFNSFIVKDQ
jgi:hypothetical protein